MGAAVLSSDHEHDSSSVLFHIFVQLFSNILEIDSNVQDSMFLTSLAKYLDYAQLIRLIRMYICSMCDIGMVDDVK